MEKILKMKSVVDLNYCHGENPHKCGYCQKKKGSVSIGFTADHVLAEDYKDLMDRGWRRCGCYYYQPNLEKSCCKWYVIVYKLKKGILLEWIRQLIRKKRVIKRFIRNGRDSSRGRNLYLIEALIAMPLKIVR